LEVDTNTRLDVKLDGATRRVILYGGQIHIAVAPDAARPFQVEAAGGVVRALGTAFDVRRDGDAVRVAVTEHVVRVTYPRGPDGARADVAAGQTVAYGPEMGLGRVGAANLTAATAWQRGRLVFDEKPLREVVAEMERYRPGLILIRDERLAKLPVTGVFDLKDSDALLQALVETLPIKVRVLPWVAVIEPDPSRPAR
jgi:transmembrane sensor